MVMREVDLLADWWAASALMREDCERTVFATLRNMFYLGCIFVE